MTIARQRTIDGVRVQWRTIDSEDFAHIEPRRAQVIDEWQKDRLWRELAEILLSIAGEWVVPPLLRPSRKTGYEEFLRQVMARSQRFASTGVRKGRGKPGLCHQNAARIARDSPSMMIMSGFALSRDGRWREHSWILDSKRMELVETCDPRVLYFGFVLRPEEAKGFIGANA